MCAYIGAEVEASMELCVLALSPIILRCAQLKSILYNLTSILGKNFSY